jgi:hypothetical protein
LYCLSFDLQILIIPLVSSNSSYPSRASELNPSLCRVYGAWSLVFCVSILQWILQLYIRMFNTYIWCWNVFISISNIRWWFLRLLVILVWAFVLFLLSILLSVVLRFTDSHNPFGIVNSSYHFFTVLDT